MAGTNVCRVFARPDLIRMARVRKAGPRFNTIPVSPATMPANESQRPDQRQTLPGTAAVQTVSPKSRL
jgi:hypothetical protein